MDVCSSQLYTALGVAPGPLTDALLDAAVAVGLTEKDDLDRNAELHLRRVYRRQIS